MKLKTRMKNPNFYDDFYDYYYFYITLVKHFILEFFCASPHDCLACLHTTAVAVAILVNKTWSVSHSCRVTGRHHWCRLSLTFAKQPLAVPPAAAAAARGWGLFVVFVCSSSRLLVVAASPTLLGKPKSSFHRGRRRSCGVVTQRNSSSQFLTNVQSLACHSFN